MKKINICDIASISGSATVYHGYAQVSVKLVSGEVITGENINFLHESGEIEITKVVKEK